MKHYTPLAVLAIAGSVAAAPHGHGLHLPRDIAASSTVSERSAEADVDPPAPTVTGITKGCTKWWTVQAGDYCQLIVDKEGITLDQFYVWNPQVNTNGPCASLWAGYAYCVATGGSPSKSHSTSLAPAPAPAPSTASVKAPAPPPASSSAPVNAPAPAPTTTKATTTYAPPPAATTYAPPPAATTNAPAPAPANPSVYKSYNGDGSVAQGWPATTSWTTFDAIWQGQQHNMASACTNNGWGVENSPQENAALRQSIIDVATKNSVDERFVLAIVLQESWGCVRVPTTNNGVVNPGVMQDHNGAASCHGAAAGACSDATIKQMIVDGVEGTSSGDGLKQIKSAQGGPYSGAQQYYVVARTYNSGSFDPSNLSNPLGSTASYASDVANKLTGYTGGSSGWSAA